MDEDGDGFPPLGCEPSRAWPNLGARRIRGFRGGSGPCTSTPSKVGYGTVTRFVIIQDVRDMKDVVRSPGRRIDSRPREMKPVVLRQFEAQAPNLWVQRTRAPGSRATARR